MRSARCQAGAYSRGRDSRGKQGGPQYQGGALSLTCPPEAVSAGLGHPHLGLISSLSASRRDLPVRSRAAVVGAGGPAPRETDQHAAVSECAAQGCDRQTHTEEDQNDGHGQSKVGVSKVEGEAGR